MENPQVYSLSHLWRLGVLAFPSGVSGCIAVVQILVCLLHINEMWVLDPTCLSGVCGCDPHLLSLLDMRQKSCVMSLVMFDVVAVSEMSFSLRASTSGCYGCCCLGDPVTGELILLPIMSWAGESGVTLYPSRTWRKSYSFSHRDLKVLTALSASLLFIGYQNILFH